MTRNKRTGWKEGVTRLATEESVPAFCEKATEGEGSTTSSGGWGEILCGGSTKPVGNADRDQSEAKTTAVSHRTENVSFSAIKVFIYICNSCTV